MSSMVAFRDQATCDAAELTLCSLPMMIANIMVKAGQTFSVHKTILTQDSTYFDEALNERFPEVQSQTMHLDDINGIDFGFYIAVQDQLSMAKAQG